MRLRGSSSWEPLTVEVRLVSWLRIQRAAGHRAQHRQDAIPNAGAALVGGTRPERNRRAGRVDVLPPAGMGKAELLSGGGHGIGGAGAGEVRQGPIVVRVQAGLFPP